MTTMAGKGNEENRSRGDDRIEDGHGVGDVDDNKNRDGGGCDGDGGFVITLVK